VTNRLAQATSPYLLQHAHNPVDWYPWGEEALSRAQAENKPILLSIGYSACHWCHVMERESFENDAIAALMNASFVCVKVDREERPDLDDIYMAATLAMNQGQGGWPMTVFLTPDQEPFFAGTYFPPEDRYGRPGFPSLLKRIAELWETDPAGLRGQARQLVQFLQDNSRPAPGLTVGEAEIKKGLEQLARDFDPRWGGFSGAPKFPPSAALSLLLRGHRRYGDEQALAMVRKTLDAMAHGGMYDHVGGGFSRYSVDERWLVPHFEKMLYDNAQLARVYLEGFQVTREPFYQRIAGEILDYVLREMHSPEGGFYSATDADSEGVEGKFFVWTPAQVRAAVGDDEEARRFCAYYDITEAGNWEGHNIPHTPSSLVDVAALLGIAPDELERSLAAARPKVYKARLSRVKPGLDDKVLTAWNGLLIGTLAEAYRVLGDPRYLHAAEKAAQFLLGTLRTAEGRLLRTFRAGQAHIPAVLEDYAYLTYALVDLYEASGTVHFLHEATTLAERMHADFVSEDGGFFSTARDHEPLIVRHREGHDGAVPSANAMAALALARLSYHLDRADFREDAVRAIRAYGRAVQRQPRAFATTLFAVDLLLEGPVELALVGTPGTPDFDALWRELGIRYLPNRILALHDPASGEAAPGPLLQGKELVGGRAALYVCRNFACQRPVTDPGGVSEALSGITAGPEATGNALAGARLAGAATAEATAAYARRQSIPATGYSMLGTTGLTVSRLGFGGYRTDDESAAHHEALRRAFLSGLNLVDTSSNYTDGGSERLVGEVLEEALAAGELRREEIVVVTKLGYAQGESLELAKEREEAEDPFPEMVKYADAVWHCIHPEFLADQLARSLDRLQLTTVDVCLLHNPEYFLTDGHERSHGTLEKRREEFARRMQAAFSFLESEVQKGRLQWYGVSSNMVALPGEDPEAVSFDLMLGAARQAGGEAHHFRVLQLPLNLLEAGGVFEKSAGAGQRTVLQAAAAAGVGVLANRPLNAMAHESLVRLAPLEEKGEPTDVEAQLAILDSLESEYRRDIAAHLEAGEGSVPPEHFFRWSADLRGVSAHLQSVEQWEALEQQRILPRLLQALQALDQSLQGGLGEAWQDWRRRYVPELRILLAELRRQATARTVASLARLSAAIDPLLPAARRAEPLSRKALWVAASTEGVSSVLNGMRHRAYVDDALAVLAWPKLPDPTAVYAAAREAAPRPADGTA
jgi:uncharacterized protein